MIRIAVALLLVSSAANAAVYKCTVGGKSIFQDRPCEGASKDDHQVEVRAMPATAPTPPPAASSAEAAPATGPTSAQEWIRKRDLENRRNALKSKIASLERKGAGIHEMHQVQLKLLDVDASQANNNLAGATYLQSIAAKKQALAQTYEADMAANQSALDRATEELRSLE